MRGSRKCRGSEGLLTRFFKVINVFHRGSYEPPFGSNCFSRGSVSVFLRKIITACDFPGGGGGGSGPPVPLRIRAGGLVL